MTDPSAPRAAALVATAALFALTSPTAAQERPAEFPRPALGRAAACYTNLDYACVTALLANLPRWYDPANIGAVPEGVRLVDVPLLLEAGRILAVSHLALGQSAPAQDVFRWMLKVEPSYALTGAEIPPRFFNVFYALRAEAIGKVPAARIEATAAARALGLGRGRTGLRTAARVADMEGWQRRPVPFVFGFGLRVSAGIVGLTRADAEVFKDGPGLALGIDVLLDTTGWILSAELGGSTHNVRLDDLVNDDQNELLQLHATLFGGYELRLDWLGVRPSIGLGLEVFGVSEFFENVGPVTTFRLGLDGHLPLPVLLMGTVDVRVVTVFEEKILTSVLVSAGLGVGIEF